MSVNESFEEGEISCDSSAEDCSQSQHSFHESDSGSNSDDSATNRIKRKRYCNLQGRCEEHTKEDGGAMALPLQQQHSHQTVWTSVLEDQNLSSDMSRVNMDKMLDGDRTVESYDYTRAADDQRPDLLPKDGVCGETENELFSEVIDMDKVISRHKCNLKRKYGHMTSTDLSRCDRLQLPAVLNRVSNEEVTYYISSSLQEKKVHLIKRIVSVLGPDKALDLLRKTDEVEAGGGMLVMNRSRRRSKGGVYLALLKTGSLGVTSEQQDNIFKEEMEKATDMRKMKKARKRENQRRKLEQKKIATLGDGNDQRGMDENSSLSGQGECIGHPIVSENRAPDGANGDDSERGDDREQKASYDDALQREIDRQQKSSVTSTSYGNVTCHGVTLCDVLDMNMDEDILDLM